MGQQVSINTTIHSTTDALTGEILSKTVSEETEIKGTGEAEPAFIKLYLARIAKIQNLNKSQCNVLFEICKWLPFANDIQTITLTAYIKRQIAATLKVTEGYVSDTISGLVKEKVLFRMKDPANPKARTGAYQVNPIYIARGNWGEIKKLQLKLSFDAVHGEFIDSVDITNKDGQVSTVYPDAELAPVVTSAPTAANPLPEVETFALGNCPKCGKPLKIKNGSRGEFIGCSDFPTCKYTCDVPDAKRA